MMESIEMRKVRETDLDALQEIGRQTFHETFAEVNTEANMRKYLEEGFSEDKTDSGIE
jgi:diamine N-acetyltransferase